MKVCGDPIYTWTEFHVGIKPAVLELFIHANPIHTA
jgi:hypothetical protein